MYVTLFWAVVLLFSKHRNNKAKYFLGVFMIVAFFVYLSHAVYFKQHNDIFIYFDPLYTFASLSVYPLYYWYIKLLTSEVKINYKNLKLLIPALFFSFALLILYILMSPQERINYIDRVLFNKPINELETINIKTQKVIYLLGRLTFIIQIIVFMILGTKLVKRYNRRVANFYSNLENRTILWVKMLLISFIVTSLISIVFNIIGRAVFINLTYLLVIPSVIFSGLLFIIGFQGYLQNYTVVDLVKDENTHPEIDLRDFNHQLLKEKLLKLFEDETIYRDSNLKMTQISVLLQTNRTYISNLINNDFSCSFSEFVNRYRVTDAKRILVDEQFKNHSLTSISEVAGFGSLATFIRVFKEMEGVPPGKYRELYCKKVTAKN